MSLLTRLSVLLVALGALLALPAGSTEAAQATIQVGNYWFCDASYANGTCPTTINVGDTVQWNFPSGIYHTTTDCGASCGTPTGSPMWDSGLQIGGSYSYTFTQAGVYQYHCSIHDAPVMNMRGQITVVAGAVGGIASLPDTANAPLDSAPRATGSAGTVIGTAAIVAGLVVVAGATWYARRRLRIEDHRS